MGILSSFKAERLITQIKTAGDTAQPAIQKAMARLAGMGPAAIPKIIEALGNADKNETIAYVEVLTGMLSDKTFSHYAKGLEDPNPRAIAAVSWAMTSTQKFNANKLIELFDLGHVSKPALIEVLNAHKKRLNVNKLLQKAYEVEPNEKAALFQLIGELADESIIPDLVGRLSGRDTIARVHIINVVSQFDHPDVQHALQEQLKDKNKLIRQAALNALSKMQCNVDIQLLCSLLLDSEIEVQNKAVDVIVKVNHKDTVKHLIPALKAEFEFSRRSAVEVLNEICDTDSIKNLLAALEDEDWWVRSRAGDALAKIGGPRVIDAVLHLIKDEDENVRRASIEILNQVKDARTVDHLIEATKDEDWWVRERAVDALAGIGSTKALPRLVEMVKKRDKAMPAVVRALGDLGDARIIKPLMTLVDDKNKEIKIEAMYALAKLSDEKRADAVRKYIKSRGRTGDTTVNKAATEAIEDLERRFAATMMEQGAMVSNHPSEHVDAAKTLLMDGTEVDKIVAEADGVQKLDINALQPGDMLEGRYKYVKKIGKGAFGTVLLMEDTVVDENIILKFLNPNVASDEEIMKRFVHELRYSRKITHKNVIRIYDFLFMGGHYAISMEYFPSHTLGHEVPDEQPMDLRKALGFANDIATGMIVAHQVGIVHRDLKPANILINDVGLLKIVDFGVAAAHSSGDTQLTKTGYVIGSPKYMAPEQILGKKVDVRADIYSLGVLLYEMLTGQPPYSRGDHMSVMYQHVQGKAPQTHELNNTVPLQLSHYVAKLMAVDKDVRPQSMTEVQSELLKYIE